MSKITKHELHESLKTEIDKIGILTEEVTAHLGELASLTQVGHVRLSNDTNSTSETLAPTMKALNEVKQYASEGKTAIANAVNEKGVSASPNDAFPTLATKIGQIPTGKKMHFGQITVSQSRVSGNSAATLYQSKWISGLSFKPSQIYITSPLQTFPTNSGTVRIVGTAAYGDYNTTPVDYSTPFGLSINNVVFENDGVRFSLNWHLGAYLSSSSNTNTILNYQVIE